MLASLQLPSTAAAAGWQGPISEETSGTFCGPSNEAVNGFDCDGSYCDNVSIRCGTLPYGITMSHWNWKDFFSEEDNGIGQTSSGGWYQSDRSYSEVCNWAGAPSIMTGIRCRGRYCDDISIECGIPMLDVGGVQETIELENCSWTGPRSEEQSPLQLSNQQFISGIACYDSYCDNKTFYVCEAAPPANSCMDSCGGSAPDGCWCDAVCTQFGDCCGDYEDAC